MQSFPRHKLLSSPLLWFFITMLWAIILKCLSLPDQPIIPLRDYNGYRNLANSLLGIQPNSHLEFLLPHGYSYFIILVDWIFDTPSVSAVGKSISFLAVLLPLSIYLFFQRVCGSLLAFLLSFSYLAASETLRYETMLGTDALTSVLIACLLIALSFYRRAPQRRVIYYGQFILLSVMLLALSLIRAQFLLLHFVVIAALFLPRLVLISNRSTFRQDLRQCILPAIVISSLPTLLLLIMVFTNGYRESYWGISPLGPFNKLNYSSKYFDSFEPKSALETAFKARVLETIETSGTICTLCRGRDKPIIADLGITRAEFYTMLAHTNSAILAKNRKDYYQRVITNFLSFFSASISPTDDSYAHGYLVRYVQDNYPWKIPATILKVVESSHHPFRQFLAATILLLLVIALYRRSPEVITVTLFAYLLIIYTAAVVSVSQNAEVFRYRAPVQWVWIAYIWMATFLVIFKIRPIRRQPLPSPAVTP